MHVLVVEDEPLIRLLICDLLEEAGMACTGVGSARDALTVLDQGGFRPDLMVTDFNLGPGPDGQMLAREVQRRLPALPTVFVTGNPESFTAYPFQARDALLAKPFAGAELVALVRTLGADASATPRCPWPPSGLSQAAHQGPV